MPQAHSSHAAAGEISRIEIGALKKKKRKEEEEEEDDVVPAY
jgi:hypothetical protein